MLDVAYARRGDLSIAYAVVGNGPVDVIFGAGLVSHLELLWADPLAMDFFRQLGSFGRLILFDKPGTGLSDPVIGGPSLDERARDYLAVLDAVGSRRAIVIGLSEAFAAAAALAATYPERVEALVLISGVARFGSAPDYLPETEPWWREVWWPWLEHCAANWGDGAFLTTLSPRFRTSSLYRTLAPSIERSCASPAMARAIIHALLGYDAVPLLPAIASPTLVVYRSEEFFPPVLGRGAAERIPGSQFLELPGDEHLCFFGGDDMADAIGEFLSGRRPTRSDSHRRLTTVLFTDLVDSTAAATQMGDEHWGAVIARHDEIAAEEVTRHEGRLVKTLGDGVLAAFDRPVMSIRCARAMSARLDQLGLRMRAGIHTGECQQTATDLVGIAVHLSARIAALAKADELLVTSTVRDLILGSGVQFDERGEYELKGVPGRWQLLAVADDRSRDQQPAPHGGGAPAAATTMRRIDKAVVAVASRAPWLTRPALRIGGRLPSSPNRRRPMYDGALSTKITS